VTGAGSDLAPGSVGIANESASRLGAQYAFAEATKVNFIWEK